MKKYFLLITLILLSYSTLNARINTAYLYRTWVRKVNNDETAYFVFKRYGVMRMYIKKSNGQITTLFKKKFKIKNKKIYIINDDTSKTPFITILKLNRKYLVFQSAAGEVYTYRRKR